MYKIKLLQTQRTILLVSFWLQARNYHKFPPDRLFFPSGCHSLQQTIVIRPSLNTRFPFVYANPNKLVLKTYTRSKLDNNHLMEISQSVKRRWESFFPSGRGFLRVYEGNRTKRFRGSYKRSFSYVRFNLSLFVFY